MSNHLRGSELCVSLSVCCSKTHLNSVPSVFFLDFYFHSYLDLSSFIFWRKFRYCGPSSLNLIRGHSYSTGLNFVVLEPLYLLQDSYAVCRNEPTKHIEWHGILHSDGSVSFCGSWRRGSFHAADANTPAATETPTTETATDVTDTTEASDAGTAVKSTNSCYTGQTTAGPQSGPTTNGPQL